MSELPNYYLKARRAWLRHCATIIKPCGKTLDEVLTYLAENYDTEAMNQEKPSRHMVGSFAQHIDADRSSDLYMKGMNTLDLSESDMAFTIASRSSYSQCNDKVDRNTFAPHCLKIPLTERNIKRIAELHATSADYIPPPHEMYKDDSFGYVLWDENLQCFHTHGYGSFEIMDDLRFYHGVTAEDIEHLTYRFSRFAQLFPRGNYSISFDEFRNDMDMCRKYGFYNDQRLFTEMLHRINAQYEFVDRPAGDVYKKKWYEQFVPSSLHKNAEKHYYFSRNGFGGHMWHVFSYKDLPCLDRKQAEVMFDTKPKNECIIFFTDHSYAFKIINAKNLYAKILNAFSDVYIADVNFTWTYICTHEAFCGPYFYEIGVEYDKKL